MTFGQWLAFRGRIGRKTFWLGYVLPLLALTIVAQVLDVALGFTMLGDAVPADQVQTGPIGGLAALLTLWPSLAGAIKRLHDRDRSGWWIGGYYLLAAVCGVLIVAGAAVASAGAGGGGLMVAGFALAVVLLGYALWMLVEIGFLRGTPGPNRFGPDPLGGGYGPPQWQPGMPPPGWQPQQGGQWQQQPQWQQPQPPQQQWQPPPAQGWQSPPQGHGAPPPGYGQQPPSAPWQGPGPGGSVPPVRRE
ncbi:DUF805 domain-containing protein [Neoroseomonas soli]|uniref:DUF805 domain-containing protein n=1 Tax=Neoroseomonas soli TaxID=1081025 RepID=A0A9X9WVM4_9PROT|nr:DUF805 domain-containing protein [Neoroseomonas soli]MBR0671203.1 DUF805 domain-containing protein [Neoroseomonas soli]